MTDKQLTRDNFVGLPVWVCTNHDTLVVFLHETHADDQRCACGNSILEDSIFPMFLTAQDPADDNA